MVELEISDHGDKVQKSEKLVDVVGKKGDPGENNRTDLQVPNATVALHEVKEPEQALNNATAKVQVLFEKLQRLTDKQESQLIQLNLPYIGSDDCVGISERDSAVTSIKSMQRFYNYGSDTLAASVSYMDRFLSKVKVKRRYLSCVAAASFYLATKMNEEFEHQPTASDLSRLNRNIWKPSDLKRMEKIILDKLDWDLFPAVTCQSFLANIYCMLSLVSSNIDKRFLAMLMERSEIYINYTSCVVYKPCTLAMAIVQQCLKECDLSTLVTNFILLHVQAVAKISDSELFECQCAISKQFEIYTLHPASHPVCLPLPRLVPRPNLVIKPSCYGNTDLPTIEEVSCYCETSEEKAMLSCQYNSIQSYAPCVIYPTMKISQSYCLITDQCYCGTVGAYSAKSTCNIK